MIIYYFRPPGTSGQLDVVVHFYWNGEIYLKEKKEFYIELIAVM